MSLTMQLLILILLPAAFLLPPAARAGEIIGGQEAQPHSRPYMAYLDIKNGEDEYECGGFLLSENVVLTAAHCNGDEITVHLGAHNIRKQEESQQVIPARAKIPHPQYDEEIDNNDIMLLQLDRKVKLNKWVKTIRLPHTHKTVKPGAKCSVAGWGQTGCASTADTLQEVDVEVLDDGACHKDPDGPYAHYNLSTMLCVGDPKKGKDSAQGDSGGPLVCKGKAQGIVSWGSCCPPGVYTRISTFIPWIREEMKKLHP
ncbi:mast cell protease 1A-like [Emydura macquarii macquarii]|uniref:mast cell protease 1A-like n=1 Tax=Emydura macquarii macquarii TaxID=1129001 RepID=UPI00352AC9CF